MLSRTAGSLYWLARYLERAENLARLLEVAERSSLLPRADGQSHDEWQSVLVCSGASASFRDKGEAATRETVVAHLGLDRSNPSSILSCIDTARSNARAVRTALTAEMWETLNQSWLDLAAGRQAIRRGELLPFVDWVKERAQAFSGGVHTTMLRDEGYSFVRLGTLIERADNTARILDVKYHMLLPEDQGVGGVVDYYQWTALLRSFSANRSYYGVYRDTLKPWLIAEFLILQPQMPRSLAACLAEADERLEGLADSHGRRHECHRLAGQLNARLRYTRIEDIFEDGLHEFLTGFIARNNALSDEIASSYLN